MTVDPMLSIRWLRIVTIMFAMGWSNLPAEAQAAPPNVLFIAADDLRCDLGCYGHPSAETPHLDRLATEGIRFDRAYCAQALCNPSRSSLLTGLRPDTLGLWNLRTHFRELRPQVITLPEHFKNHGYFTQNIGKIFHNWVTEIEGDPRSWSVPAVMHFDRHGNDVPIVDGPLPPDLATDPKCECRDVPDDAYFDGRVADLSIQALEDLRAKAQGHGQPFFLAVGFWKPHSPFNAPKRYWDLYNRESLRPIRPAAWPTDAPRIAWHNSREIIGEGKRRRTLSDDQVSEIRHGYLAAISYLDAQVGRVVDKLGDLGLRDNTWIVFWSDHGYHLGEHTLWAKTSNFELDARVPMILVPPTTGSHAAADGVGRSSDSLVELLDLFPTLVDGCDLPSPPGLEGTSMLPILHDPSVEIKDAVLTQHPRPAYYAEDAMQVMGYSLRTSRYRYTQWRSPDHDQVIASELYDHRDDPDETRNLAVQAETEPLRQDLSERLDRLRSPAPSSDE